MKKLVVSEVISQAWELTKKHWATVLAGLLIIGVINVVISMMLQSKVDPQLIQQQLQGADPATVLQVYMQILSANSAATFVSSVVGLVLMVGFYQLVLNCVRGKGDFSIDAWKQPAGVYVKVAITGMIVTLLTYIGFCFCILPGIYFWGRLQFATYYLLDHKEAGIGEAISASWNRTAENGWTLFGLCFVYIGIAILGLLCCCVGVIVAEIVVYLAVVVCYISLFDNANPQPAAEPSDKQEYSRDESSNYEK